MALDLNGSGQSLYRSLSQGANPYTQSPQGQALAASLGQDPTGGQGVGGPAGPVTDLPMPMSGDPGMGAAPPPGGGALGPGGIPPHPAYGAIANAYQQWLGRPGDPQEIMSHLGNVPPSGGFGQVQYALGNIMNSPEAKLYSQTQKGLAARQKMAAGAAGPQADPGGGGAMLGNGQPNPGFAAGPAQGGLPADPGVTGQGAGVAPPPIGPSVNPPAPQQQALGNALAPAGATPPPAAATPPPAAGGAMPPGMDPALAAIYQNSGLTPADRGTGFADWQYWQGVGPSQYDRLKADIAGTGSDQPTGTPGTGAWDQSGAGAAPAAATAQGGGTPVNAPQVSPIVDYANTIPGIQGQPTSMTQGVLQALLKQLGLQGALS